MSDSTFGPSALATPANAITIARLLLTPIWLAVVAASGPSWFAFVMGFLIAVTDGVDGWLARRHGTTRSGAFLDPLADKVFVLGGLAALVAKGLLWWPPVVIIAVREIGISVFRSVLGRQGISVPARYWAKVKTVVQELAIGAALLPLTVDLPIVASVLVWAGAALAVWTGAQYLLDGRRAAPVG
ncbi:MAG: CDP-alcohol phosphatidyltransferase family protein [Acidimicrobiales bacterium]